MLTANYELCVQVCKKNCFHRQFSQNCRIFPRVLMRSAPFVRIAVKSLAIISDAFLSVYLRWVICCWTGGQFLAVVSRGHVTFISTLEQPCRLVNYSGQSYGTEVQNSPRKSLVSFVYTSDEVHCNPGDIGNIMALVGMRILGGFVHTASWRGFTLLTSTLN